MHIMAGSGKPAAKIHRVALGPAAQPPIEAPVDIGADNTYLGLYAIDVVDFPAFILVDDKGNDFFVNTCGICVPPG